MISPEKTGEILRAYSKEADDFSYPSLNSQLIINAIMLGNNEIPKGWKSIPMREALSIMSKGSMADSNGRTGDILRAFHIGQWRRESLFCGSCGSRNIDSDAELARKCPTCGRTEYPRIAPAIITVITNDRDEALLAHNKKFKDKIYALVAGFNETGENLEATVAREIREEVSIEVKDVRYVCSQPWPFTNSLMLGFTARHASGDIKVDGIEIEDAKWFSRDNLPLLPMTGSVSRYLINLWLERKL